MVFRVEIPKLMDKKIVANFTNFLLCKIKPTATLCIKKIEGNTMSKRDLETHLLPRPITGTAVLTTGQPDTWVILIKLSSKTK
jgi:hypothetical protein